MIRKLRDGKPVARNPRQECELVQLQSDMCLCPTNGYADVFHWVVIVLMFLVHCLLQQFFLIPKLIEIYNTNCQSVINDKIVISFQFT